MKVKRLVILVFLASTILAIMQWRRFEEAIFMLQGHPIGVIHLTMGKALFWISLLAFAWRLFLFRKYSPVESFSDEQLPTCTVIVPAYNEGQMVKKTIESVLKSNFPADKLQIITVDDGSVDDTWEWMERAAADANGRVLAVKLSRNSGKRVALYEGFIRSEAEVLVTIDSDSLIDPDTLRNLVIPFVSDPKVGAVAGNVKVLNKEKYLIPRMLEVSFAYSFEFIRAGQSVVNGVFCTPGALSAYRRSVVMTVLMDWMRQRFMGQPAKIGEDRAMTNAILKKGYHVTFQSNAIVYTNVPVRYKGLCKMLLRWARSNVRETIAMAAFVFSPFRQTDPSGVRANYILSVMHLLVHPLFMIGTILNLCWLPHVFIPHLLMGACISGLVPMLFFLYRRERSSEAILALAYGLFWLGSLSWITPYAIFTMANSNWMTRDIKRGKRARSGQIATRTLVHS